MSMVAPCGTWSSPITPAHAAAAGGGPAWVQTLGGEVWWTQTLPAEGGRATIMRGSPGRAAERVLGGPWNARNRVTEYGGRPFGLVDGRLVFTNWDDQRLYAMTGAGAPVPISPAPARRHGLRYAVPTRSPRPGEVLCVRETVTGDRPTDVRRDLVAVPLDGSAADDPEAVRVLAASHRFLTEPMVSPDGRHLAWIGWNHPAMPWDGTELCLARIGDGGTLDPHTVLAGGPAEAVCQVEWDGPDGVLALTDPDGWWNLYRITLDGQRRNLAPVEAELGGALWQPGDRWFAPMGGGRYAVLNAGRLAVLDETAASLTMVDTELTAWNPTLLALDGERVAGTAGGPRHPAAAVVADLSTPPGVSLTDLSGPAARPDYLPDPAYLPIPVRHVFPAIDGTPVPALVYPPTNPDFAVPEGERPPYLVQVHGGPTSSCSTGLNLQIALFTSRGFGVVAPDYGGSTGHGRAFRERLNGQWGVVDVDDCAAVAIALAEAGSADPERLIIRGGSAGGWTALASLVFINTYRCGTARFPILDLPAWTHEGGETHDFESHYLYSLVGPLPDARELYYDRSPINHLDLMTSPVLLLQGLDDQICPPAQAKRLADALAGSGIPHAYLAFEGEQHGFRKASTIEAALNAELSFYGQVLGFEPAGVPRLELSS
jgi:dipeptidyl aminopeptidase/acylaminoacyl peptidase